MTTECTCTFHTQKWIVYRAYDEEELLYVGSTNDGFRRMGQHAKTADWFSYVTHITFTRYCTREEMLAAETEAIKTEAPHYNLAQMLTSAEIEALA